MTHCGGKEGLGHNFSFHALFSTLVSRLVYYEQQRTQALSFECLSFISKTIPPLSSCSLTLG